MLKLELKLERERKIMKSEVVLAVVAHPDDEVIGVAGTLSRHAAKGDDVHILILADGETSRSNNINSKLSVQGREDSANKVAKILGAKTVTCLSFPDNKLDTVSRLELAQAVENNVDKIGATIIYTHHRGDVNIDHQRAHEAVIIASRPMPEQSVHTVLFFETASSTEWQSPASDIIFAPNYFVDIEDYWCQKLQALKVYNAEMRNFPHTRSYKAIEALAVWRGAIVGKNMAEAFIIGRKIVS